LKKYISGFTVHILIIYFVHVWLSRFKL